MWLLSSDQHRPCQLRPAVSVVAVLVVRRLKTGLISLKFYVRNNALGLMRSGSDKLNGAKIGLTIIKGGAPL